MTQELEFKPVDLPTFQKLVREIAAERPDYRYCIADEGSKCLYQPSKRHDGHTSRCLIGEALFRLGLADAELAALDRGYTTGATGVMVNLGFTEDVAVWAGGVQAKQDNGYTWSYAAS